MFARHWLVCDMDGTLTSTPTKAGGEYLSLRHSPCYEPIRRYMANGGNLCVVSTAGRRMWRQIFAELSDVMFSPGAVSAAVGGSSPRARVAGQLAICGFSGAALFLSDPTTATMKEVAEYRQTALKYNAAALYGKVAEDRAGGEAALSAVAHHELSAEQKRHSFTEATTIDVFNKAAIVDIAVGRVRQFINDAADEILAAAEAGVGEETLITPSIKVLSAKYHEPYTALANLRNKYLAKAKTERYSDEEAEDRENLLQPFYEEVLSTKRLMTHGSFIAKTRDALVDMQTVPGTEEDPVGIQVTVMGIPMRMYDKYFDADIITELASYGVSAKKQPNSVAINKKGIDKALCVQWLRDHVDGFDLSRALAFGDIPSSVDKPLAQYPPMTFVSLSTTPETDPTDTKAPIVHVGHEEVGAAEFLLAMLDELVPIRGEDEGNGETAAEAVGYEGDETLFTPDNVVRWAEAAKRASESPRTTSAL